MMTPSTGEPRRVMRVYAVKKKRFPELQRFLPCLFDVPLRIALETLGMSHHTLDPLRRALGLERWPYAEMARGRFYMKGLKWQHETCVVLRAQLLEEADDEMRQVLREIAVLAEACWSPSTSPSSQPAQHHKPAAAEASSVWDEPARDPAADVEFWEEIARLFNLHAAGSVVEEPLAAAGRGSPVPVRLLNLHAAGSVVEEDGEPAAAARGSPVPAP